MFKFVSPKTAIIDIETIPDAATIRRVYGLDRDVDDASAVAYAYVKHGASPENPKPMLKPMFQKVVSVSLLYRKTEFEKGTPFTRLSFHTLPAVADGKPEEIDEREIISRTLRFIGKNKPTVVGWNNIAFDQPLLFQRAVVLGVEIPDYCQRPNKPWEGEDYFSKFSDSNVDLMTVLAGQSFGLNPKLGDLAAACGIPGKIAGIDGSQVYDAYLDGRLAEIVAYNEFDVCSTYLIWLRMAWVGGHISAAAYAEEQETFRLLLRKRMKEGATHFDKYLAEWELF